jgi:hypothetical protein
LVYARTLSHVEGDNIVLECATGLPALDYVVLGTEVATLPEGQEKHYGLLIATKCGGDELHASVGVDRERCAMGQIFDASHQRRLNLQVKDAVGIAYSG